MASALELDPAQSEEDGTHDEPAGRDWVPRFL